MVEFYFGLRVIEKLLPVVIILLIVSLYIGAVLYSKYWDKRYAKRKKGTSNFGF